jgi:hypothetical protein
LTSGEGGGAVGGEQEQEREQEQEQEQEQDQEQERGEPMQRLPSMVASATCDQNRFVASKKPTVFTRSFKKYSTHCSKYTFST